MMQAGKRRRIAIMKRQKHARIVIALPLILMAVVVCVACASGPPGLMDGDTPPVMPHVNETVHINETVLYDEADAPDYMPEPAPEPDDDLITIKWMQYSTSLTELNLYDEELYNEDIVPLQYMTNLTVLYLSSYQISDLTPLAALSNLTELSLGLYNDQACDLTPLSSLTNLTKLDIVTRQIGDLTPLSSLTNLSSLNLVWGADKKFG